ncbi:hypothetical protein AGR1B_Cc120169 [Agrobacterium fabacearum S56]|nr:hypothetical protein AGR1B_Cc120169 [Agrobacterium fabacearum S56]
MAWRGPQGRFRARECHSLFRDFDRDLRHQLFFWWPVHCRRLCFFLLALPFYGAGLYAGARLHGLAEEAAFRRICYGLIAISAVIGLPLFDSLLK